MRLVRVALLLAVLAAACGGSRASLGAEVAATVNGIAVPTDRLATLVSAQLADPERPELEQDPQSVAQVQRDTLAQMIQDVIVAQSAEDLGVEVTPEEIEERFNETAEQFGGLEALREEIAHRGRTEADVREQLASVVRRDELQAHFREQVDVRGADLRRAYEERLASRYRVADAAHILVETEAEARDVLAQLESGTDFAELARERSIDTASGVNGGDLGENPQGSFVEAFDEAVWSAEPGDIVGPVQTEFGFHVILVRGFRDVPFAEVRDAIEEELVGASSQEAFDAWFREALTSADVLVADRFGRWDAQAGRVVPSDDLPPARGPARPTDAPAAPTATPVG